MRGSDGEFLVFDSGTNGFAVYVSSLDFTSLKLAGFGVGGDSV